MIGLERDQVLALLATWLGDDFFDPRFSDDYCSCFDAVLSASIGRLPEGLDPAVRLLNLATRWTTFTAVADAVAHRWAEVREAQEASPSALIPWPASQPRSSVPNLWGARMKPPLDLNTASVHELGALPGLGATTAGRIVARRLAYGPYASVEELVRIRGLSKAARERALPYLVVGKPQPASMAIVSRALTEHAGSMSFPALVRLMHEHDLWPQGARVPEIALSAPGRAREELRRLASWCRRKPHWPPDRGADIQLQDLATESLHQAEKLARTARVSAAATVIRNSAYLDFLLSLIAGAQQRILVQMFFATSPGETSPGDRIIAALVDAVKRTVDVRLILDTDLEGDYHGASKVNAETIEQLQATGLDYRLDELGITSHSKAVIVDDSLLIGSHNWTTRAMYMLDETSIYAESSAVVGPEVERFDRLWKHYHPNPSQRSIHFALLAFLYPFERRRLSSGGYESSRAFLDDHTAIAAVRTRARTLDIDDERLIQFWRMLRLMHALALPEPTAFALTLTPVNSPSQFRQIARARTLKYLRELGTLPAPYTGRRLRLDVVEAVDA